MAHFLKNRPNSLCNVQTNVARCCLQSNDATGLPVAALCQQQLQRNISFVKANECLREMFSASQYEGNIFG